MQESDFGRKLIECHNFLTSSIVICTFASIRFPEKKNHGTKLKMSKFTTTKLLFSFSEAWALDFNFLTFAATL